MLYGGGPTDSEGEFAFSVLIFASGEFEGLSGIRYGGEGPAPFEGVECLVVVREGKENVAIVAKQGRWRETDEIEGMGIVVEMGTIRVP